MSSFCFIYWITVKMTKMIMKMASSASDLNHIEGPNDIPSMPSSSLLQVTERKTKGILERDF